MFTTARSFLLISGKSRTRQYSVKIAQERPPADDREKLDIFTAMPLGRTSLWCETAAIKDSPKSTEELGKFYERDKAVSLFKGTGRSGSNVFYATRSLKDVYSYALTASKKGIPIAIMKGFMLVPKDKILALEGKPVQFFNGEILQNTVQTSNVVNDPWSKKKNRLGGELAVELSTLFDSQTDLLLEGVSFVENDIEQVNTEGFGDGDGAKFMKSPELSADAKVTKNSMMTRLKELGLTVDSIKATEMLKVVKE